jgi:Family of unknown function (DUF5994)
VNGISSERRLARPVRLALASVRGGDIDGAWWPHTGSVAGELPGLIAALRQALGEIADISINWAATDSVPDLDSMRNGARALPGAQEGQQRLMVINGHRDRATLLVIPHRTTPALGLMVLRRAAALPISDAYQASPAFDTAGRVVRAAQAQSALWMERFQTLGIPDEIRPSEA